MALPRTAWVLTLALSALTGCLDDLPQSSRLVGLRVLAIKATPPEVAPGAKVALEALVVDTLERDVTLEWYACAIPERGSGLFSGSVQSGTSGGGGYGLGAVDSCADPDLVAAGLSMHLGSGPTAELVIPDDLLSKESVLKAYGIPASSDVPELALVALRSIAGVNMTVSLVARTEGDEVEALKRVNVSLATPRNENPAELAFLLRPAPDPEEPPATGTAKPGACFVDPPSLDSGSYEIIPLNVPTVPVEYPVLVGGTSAEALFQVATNEEVYFYSFFSATGGFTRNVIKSKGNAKVGWDFPALPTEPVDVYIVVRDGRGGTAWCHSKL